MREPSECRGAAGQELHLPSERARATVFLDRDGTIHHDVGYTHRPDQLDLMVGAAEGIRRLNQRGFRVVVVTNQAGVARGYYTEEAVRSFHDHLSRVLCSFGARIDAYYFCPCHPAGMGRYRRDCDSRKPGTGMFERAQRECRVDVSRSWMIGDSVSDMEFARRVGLAAILVPAKADAASAAPWGVGAAFVTCAHFEAAVEHILTQSEVWRPSEDC